MLSKVFMISKNHLYDDKTTLQTAPTIQLNISIQFASGKFYETRNTCSFYKTCVKHSFSYKIFLNCVLAGTGADPLLDHIID